MECNVVKDLIPLYIDGCCSEESAKLVLEHIKGCKDCMKLYDEMKAPAERSSKVSPPVIMTKLNNWKASVLQSALLLFSFIMITVGVALEARTPLGPLNGFWAMLLVVPATGFMLSLANWYFIRLYRSRRSFSYSSFAATFIITVCAYFCAGIYYSINPFIHPAWQGSEIFHGAPSLALVGFLVTAFFSIISKLFSDKFAKMLGKE